MEPASGSFSLPFETFRQRDQFYLDVESVGLGKLFLVAGVVETKASPASTQHTRIGTIQRGALHPKVWMVICHETSMELNIGSESQSPNLFCPSTEKDSPRKKEDSVSIPI